MGTSNNVPAGQWAGRRDILDVTVSGAITVPEFRTIKSNGQDLPVLKFSVCSNKVRRNTDGGAVQFTEFPRVAVWGPLATKLAEILTKGSIVVIKGELRSNTYKSTKYFAVTTDGRVDRSKPANFTSWEINVGRSGSVNIMHLAKEGDKAVAASTPPAADDLIAAIGGNLTDDVRKQLAGVLLQGLLQTKGQPFSP